MSIVLVVLATLCSPSIHATADATGGVRVSFEGNRVFTEDQLRSAMSSREHSQLTRGSKVTEELQQGLQRLREFLMAEGYLTPRFGKPRVEDGPTGLIFKVHLGRDQGDRGDCFSERKIIEALDMKQGDTFRGDTISTWFERVTQGTLISPLSRGNR